MTNKNNNCIDSIFNTIGDCFANSVFNNLFKKKDKKDSELVKLQIQIDKDSELDQLQFELEQNSNIIYL